MTKKNIGSLVIIALAVLSAAMLANSMTKQLAHDEQMYCAGAALLSQGKMIYRDFSYPGQMPYHPAICAALFRIFGTTYYLLVGRMFSAVCDILTMLCLFSIVRQIFRDSALTGRFWGLAAAALYVFNPIVDYAAGLAWNHSLVILCVVFSFRLFMSADFNITREYRRAAVIGALLTVATWSRITTVLVQFLFFVLLLIRPAESAQQRLKKGLSFLAASAVVSIWPLCTIVLAPRAFFLNLILIPALNGQWQSRLDMPSRTNTILASVTTPGYMVLVAGAVFLWALLALRRQKLNQADKTNVWLAVLLAFTFFVIAVVPPAVFEQYFAPPVPFLIIAFAYPLLYLRKPPTKRVLSYTAAVAVASCIIVTLASYCAALGRIPSLFSFKNWTAINVHSISCDIAERTKAPKLILTLAPLYALEGGGEIYLQLGAGPFAYRIADFMTSEQLAVTNTVGPKALAALVEKSAPSAVVLGAEPRFLEEPLESLAVGRDWRKQAYDAGLVAHFRP